MKSAIGEGMTRKDHGDVSNQLVIMNLKECGREYLTNILLRFSMPSTLLVVMLLP